MHFLLTNDDGIEAPGLAALARAVADFGTLQVVAPATSQSGVSHAMSDRSPLRVTARPFPGVLQAHAVEGRPADCARLGLTHYAPEADWVLAGINSGGNLGVDVYYSGTVAAAREAAILGRPAIAVSQFVRDPRTLDWERSGRWAAHVISQILVLPHVPGRFWNINLPHPTDDAPPQVVTVPLAIVPLDVRYHHDDHAEAGSVFHYRGVYQSRPRRDGSDVDAVFAGQIAVTPLGLDTTLHGPDTPRFTSPAS